jgi:hypothetical protein
LPKPAQGRTRGQESGSEPQRSAQLSNRNRLLKKSITPENVILSAAKNLVFLILEILHFVQDDIVSAFFNSLARPALRTFSGLFLSSKDHCQDRCNIEQNKNTSQLFQ